MVIMPAIKAHAYVNAVTATWAFVMVKGIFQSCFNMFYHMIKIH